MKLPFIQTFMYSVHLNAHLSKHFTQSPTPEEGSTHYLKSQANQRRTDGFLASGENKMKMKYGENLSNFSV